APGESPLPGQKSTKVGSGGRKELSPRRASQRLYALWGLFRGKVDRYRRPVAWPVRGRPSILVPATAVRPRLSTPVWARSGLYTGRRTVLPPLLRHGVRRHLGPALPLPGLPAPSADADRNRILERHAAIRPPGNRVHLHVRSWTAECFRSANLRLGDSGMDAAAERFLDRAGRRRQATGNGRASRVG